MSGLYPLLNDGRDRHSAVVTSKSTKEPRIEGALGRGYDPTQEKQRYDDSRWSILPLEFWWMISFASRVVHSSQTPSPSHLTYGLAFQVEQNCDIRRNFEKTKVKNKNFWPKFVNIVIQTLTQLPAMSVNLQIAIERNIRNLWGISKKSEESPK